MDKERLGRYRIVKELGRGSMGQVFLAHDPEIDRMVAVKTVHIFASLPENERAAARERFLREVRAAGKLLHPGIVAIFDVGDEDGVPYLAMEYVEGRTLDVFCREGALLSVETVVEIVAGAADALDYAHRAGIVHRDIKPANLLRVQETSVKIMDFGLAKDPHTALTQDGALVGTPSYMSPEQIRGEPLDGRTDLFSLGVVLYELLTGEKPFSGESVSSVLYRIVHEEPRDASALNQDRVPPALSAFLKKALAKQPADRFQTAAEFAAAVRDAGRGVYRSEDPAATVAAAAESPAPATASPATPAAERTSSAPPKRRRSRVGLIFGAFVLAVVAAVVALYFTGQLPWDLAALIGGEKPPQVFEARVRTEPPGLTVLFDGEEIVGNRVRFPAAPPYGMLTAAQDCRNLEYGLSPADANGEIVLVADPVTMELSVDPGVEDAAVRLNGAEVGAAPVRLVLDLCRENEVEVRAEGRYPAVVTLPAGATPLEARTAVAGLVLEAIPVGTLFLPKTATPVVMYVDGKRVERSDAGVELPAGSHKLRAASKKYWIDVSTDVEVPPGGEVRPEIGVPPLAVLSVQAFPSNCKVYLRRSGGSWVYVDTTPMSRKFAAGRYDVRVEFVPTGEVLERTVDLRPGTTKPERFSFARTTR